MTILLSLFGKSYTSVVVDFGVENQFGHNTSGMTEGLGNGI